jgi:hypothetical protein
MLSVREHDARQCYLVLSLHGIWDHGKRIGTCLAVGYDVIWLVQVSFIDVLSRNEIVDFDCVRAFELYGLKFFLVDLDVSAFGKFVAPPLVLLVNDPACLLVNQLLL